MSEITSNGIGDGWFDMCCAVPTTVFQTFFSSFQFIFHFDSLNWVVIELLIIMPIFFRLYGFGIQQKLTKFYNKARFQLITFLFYFSFITVFSCVLQYLLPRSPACQKWNGLDLEPLRTDYGSPSVIIMLSAILFLMFFTYSDNHWTAINICFLIFLLVITISAVLSGTNSIFQAFASLCIGFWFFFLFNFLPLIFLPASTLIIGIVALALFLPVIWGENYTSAELSCATNGVRAVLLLIVTCILFIEYAYSIDNFQWFQIKWRGVTITNGNEDSVAVIPGVLKFTDEDRFGKKLIKDIIWSIILFFVVLICNCLSVSLLKYNFYD